MAKVTDPPITQNYSSPSVIIQTGTGVTSTEPANNPDHVVLFTTANAAGSKLLSLIICSDNDADLVVQFWRSTDGGTTKYLLFSILVPIGAGTDGVIPSVDALGNVAALGMALDQNNRQTLPLKGSETGSAERIYVGVSVNAVTSSKSLYINGSQENFENV